MSTTSDRENEQMRIYLNDAGLLDAHLTEVAKLIEKKTLKGTDTAERSIWKLLGISNIKHTEEGTATHWAVRRWMNQHPNITVGGRLNCRYWITDAQFAEQKAYQKAAAFYTMVQTVADDINGTDIRHGFRATFDGIPMAVDAAANTITVKVAEDNVYVTLTVVANDLTPPEPSSLRAQVMHRMRLAAAMVHNVAFAEQQMETANA